MVDVSQMNPLKDIGFGTIGFVILMVIFAVLIIGLVGVLVFLYIRGKKLKYRIPTTKKIGNTVMWENKKGYRAMDFNVSSAGDKLWYIPKLKKYISPATLQTAPNEYTHHIREDGEWINICFSDIDEKMKKMDVKWVDQDMRSNRVAIGDIIEQRFKERKSWWEKYGALVTYIIFYLIVTIALVIIFYQWGDITDKVGKLVGKLDRIIAEQQKGKTAVVPEFLIPFTFLFRKNKYKKLLKTKK